ncbi:MAG: rhamnogalacturonan lyase [Deltaproteobacteria bacterium]|nr:rhamnogalacturonan lyase [Deltaproteobacteria bacterium]
MTLPNKLNKTLVVSEIAYMLIFAALLCDCDEGASDASLGDARAKTADAGASAAGGIDGAPASGAGGVAGSNGSIHSGGAGGADTDGAADSKSGVEPDMDGAAGRTDGAAEQSDGAAGRTDNGSLGDGFYRVERLNRGIVAIQVSGGVYLGWRVFGYEYDPRDANGLSYNVYRDGVNIANVTDSSNYLDLQGASNASYSVRAIIAGVEGEESETASAWPNDYLRIALQPPPPGRTPSSAKCENANEAYTYSANDASVGDADGDGRYEIFLKWEPSNAKDNSQSGCTGNVYLDAYSLDGDRLWRIDLGINIRAGAHYTQFVVYDFDGDGRAEVAVKTAPGTKDGGGQFLHMGPAASDDDAADYRSVNNAANRTGYVLSGPEYLTVFDGNTGAERATVNFEQARGRVNNWGDDYGNRVDRFLASAAYLDDSGLASIVMARGYYTRSTLTAWNFRNEELTLVWKFDSDQTSRDASGKPFSGQGAHSMAVADVDSDGRQEIVYGAMLVDHDGRGRCSTGLGHGDALHVGDLVPSRTGLEVFMPHESTNVPSYDVRDAETCELIVSGPVTGKDTGRGAADDIVASNTGAEIWTNSSNAILSATTGRNVGSSPSSCNFLIWWDADESRELEDGTSISKYAGETLLHCGACASNNGTKSTPALTADILGDWREEVVWRESDSSALRVYTTTALTKRRIYTLMHDPQYRMQVSSEQTAYNQPPHPSFHIGSEMVEPPTADIDVR